MREKAKQFTDANTYESIISSSELVNQFLDLCYESIWRNT